MCVYVYVCPFPNIRYSPCLLSSSCNLQRPSLKYVERPSIAQVVTATWLALAEEEAIALILLDPQDRIRYHSIVDVQNSGRLIAN